MTEIAYNEADTCRKFVTPRLVEAGWETPPHSITEQRYFTDGRITVTQGKGNRGDRKRADYILRYQQYPLAVVEAKEYAAPASTGLQQAKDYAEILGFKFAYATNGQEIIEFDYITGQQRTLTRFPSPQELWARLSAAQRFNQKVAQHILEPLYNEQGKVPRYYQEIAINRAVQTIAQGTRRLLLTLATGTGKTFVAFQICWKLWNSRWNRTGEHRRPRILFLADRNVLIDDPKDKTFTPFADARFKIEGGEISKGREMYFALYQSLAASEGRPGRYTEFPRDFFDLIVVDECHRGSARDDSSWREILEYFKPAYQLGLTATPLREDNRDTYQYFGNPIYQYSLKQGIEDGFLAPYTVYRIVTDLDATGWRPTAGQLDRYGRAIPDQEYTTQDFERVVALRERTGAIANHLTSFLKKSGNPFAKTVVFCVDQEHALEMRDAIAQANRDLLQQYPDYVCRVTSDEKEIGAGHLDTFKDVETLIPAILTTSKLLTTGVDMPTVKNVVIARVVNSMTEFKQIIGRGTRVRDDYGKLFFNILDYTGSATKLFADPEFDGDPVATIPVAIDAGGEEINPPTDPPMDGAAGEGTKPYPPPTPNLGDLILERRKLYVDNVPASVITEVVYDLDASGRRTVVKFTDLTGEQVRTLYPNSLAMRMVWADPEKRADFIKRLAENNIDLERLAQVLNQPDVDAFDLLCSVAFQAPVKSRRERAQRVELEETAFFAIYTGPAREILQALLAKYAQHGVTQFELKEVLKLPEFARYGNVSEIARHFGGAEKLKKAVNQLQTLLYAA
jgi:type I restriction enzyme R subunit